MNEVKSIEIREDDFILELDNDQKVIISKQIIMMLDKAVRENRPKTKVLLAPKTPCVPCGKKQD